MPVDVLHPLAEGTQCGKGAQRDNAALEPAAVQDYIRLMRQWLMLFLLALAIAGLPFGMGVMMQAHAVESRGTPHVHAVHHGKLPHQAPQNGTMQFTVCGACLSLLSAGPVMQDHAIGANLQRPELAPRFTGMNILPATPPPRA